MSRLVLQCSRVRAEEPYVKPTVQRPEDAGLDLSVSRYALVCPGQDAHLSTNVAVAMPSGYFGLLVPRSSTLWRKGLHVSPGVVDSEYRGEIMILVRNLTERNVVINVGERVAQLLVLPLWRSGIVVEVDQLEGGTRGSAGFGSTGGYSED